jgi:thymidylate synthase ThyX
VLRSLQGFFITQGQPELVLRAMASADTEMRVLAEQSIAANQAA